MRNVFARFGLTSPADVAKVASVPLCTVCVIYPIVIPPLMMAGVLTAGTTLHLLLPILAPIDVWLLQASFRKHGRPLGLILAAASIPFILAHMAGHVFFARDEFFLLVLIWIGGGLLIGGLLVDWRAQRDLARRGGCATPEAYWRAILSGEHPGLRYGRGFFARLPGSSRCKLCNAPFTGPFAPLMRLLGKGRSDKNPRFCGDCLTKTPVGGAETELSLLFADVRGSSVLAAQSSPRNFALQINWFYNTGADVLTRTDALINRLMGDQIIGLYVPGFAGPDHARRAVWAAQKLLRATDRAVAEGSWLPIGIGVHSGTAYVGAVGVEGALYDFTVLGDTANTAARLAAAAAPGEILISAAACSAAYLERDDLERRYLRLKGRVDPLDVSILRTGTGPCAAAMP